MTFDSQRGESLRPSLSCEEVIGRDGKTVSSLAFHTAYVTWCLVAAERLAFETASVQVLGQSVDEAADVAMMQHGF